MNAMANFSQMSFVSFYHKTGHFCSKVSRFMIISRLGQITILRSNFVSDTVLRSNWASDTVFDLKKILGNKKKLFLYPQGSIVLSKIVKKLR